MVILLSGDNLRITGVNRTNRALPNNRRLQLGMFLGTDAQVALPKAGPGVPQVVQSPVVHGLLNDNYYFCVTHVDSYVKPAPVPHVDNCRNVYCIGRTLLREYRFRVLFRVKAF